MIEKTIVEFCDEGLTRLFDHLFATPEKMRRLNELRKEGVMLRDSINYRIESDKCYHPSEDKDK